MGIVFFLVCLFCAFPAHGAVLHINDTQIPLSDAPHTSPTLVVNMNGTNYWGALFNDTAPANTLRLNVGGEMYWLGEYCAPGTYLPPESGRCADCGLGHYCTGGRHRATCSGGIIGCPGTNAASDVASPTLVNRLLTADEINTNVPSTNLSQWRQISCCAGTDNDYYNTLQQDWSAVNSVRGCAGGVLNPGTYLFTVRTGSFCSSATDPFDGYANCAYSANLAVFDHAVSYKTIHAANVFYHFLDIDGTEFTDWDIHVPGGHFCDVDIRANVDGLANVPRSMCVYELK